MLLSFRIFYGEFVLSFDYAKHIISRMKVNTINITILAKRVHTGRYDAGRR